jgi:hypothetical protein
VTHVYGAAGGEGDFCVGGDADEGGCVLAEGGAKERSGNTVLWAERDPRTRPWRTWALGGNG